MARGGKSKFGATLFAILALTALIAGITMGIVFRKVMIVKNIRVEGVDEPAAQQIIDMADVKLGQSIYDVDAKQVAINLRKDGYLKFCGLNIEKPDTVIINVEQRRKAAAIQHLGFTYIVDPELSVLEVCGSPGFADVPLISGAKIQQTPVGVKLNIDTATGGALKTALCAVYDSGVADQLSEINIENLADVYVVTRSGYVFRMGGFDKLADKLKWIEPMCAQLASEGKTRGTVDMASDTSADYIPPKATPTATPAPTSGAANPQSTPAENGFVPNA